jgi:hypothetical protein
MGSSSTSNWNGDLCFCGVLCAKRVSWTRENPGRRFIACKNYDPNSKWRGCKKFKWLNEELEKTKKKLKIERKSTLTLGRLARRLKYLGFGIVVGFFISCIFMNVV